MKSIVKGKIVEKIYSVECEYSQSQDVKEKQYLLRKPKLRVEEKVIYKDICEFEGDFVYNSGVFSTDSINISEDEEVEVEKTVFRADLNEQHIFADKVLEEKEVYKEVAEKELAERLKIWNKQVIENDEELLAYCNLHKLDIENVNLDDLIKITCVKSRNDSLSAIAYMYSVLQPNFKNANGLLDSMRKNIKSM